VEALLLPLSVFVVAVVSEAQTYLCTVVDIARCERKKSKSEQIINELCALEGLFRPFCGHTLPNVSLVVSYARVVKFQESLISVCAFI
jgi:hypothetical protein